MTSVEQHGAYAPPDPLDRIERAALWFAAIGLTVVLGLLLVTGFGSETCNPETSIDCEPVDRTATFMLACALLICIGLASAALKVGRRNQWTSLLFLVISFATWVVNPIFAIVYITIGIRAFARLGRIEDDE